MSDETKSKPFLKINNKSIELAKSDENLKKLILNELRNKIVIQEYFCKIVTELCDNILEFVKSMEKSIIDYYDTFLYSFLINNEHYSTFEYLISNGFALDNYWDLLTNIFVIKILYKHRKKKIDSKISWISFKAYQKKILIYLIF